MPEIKPNHGGQLHHAAKRFGIPLSDWLDLSTGINPHAWLVPNVPKYCWQRLPEEDDDLICAASTYYGCTDLLPVAGSQAAIQHLPTIRKQSKILIPAATYSEHAANWRAAGHDVTERPLSAFGEIVHEYDVVVVVNPDNPSGELVSPNTLLHWHELLLRRNGWLVVDEAFIDSTPEHSLLAKMPKPGLIILRSLGKFFGLAGLRCGFVFCSDDIQQQLGMRLGPWSLSHPTRWIATKALRDSRWHDEMRLRLKIESNQLKHLIDRIGGTPLGGTSLFYTIGHHAAKQIFDQFAQQGILTRLLDNQSGIRFGLPGAGNQWERLEKVISQI